jgi:branched-chain amino acid aminotransferase
VGAVWLGEGLVDESSAGVSPFDHGLVTGDGVFETLRVYRGQPFARRRHLRRLARSAAGLRLALPAPELVSRAMDEVVAANGLVDGRVRVTLTGGPSALGSERGDAGPTLIVTAGPPPAWPSAAAVVTVPWPRNERGAVAGLKTISYAENVVALAHARDQGAQEAIFGNLAGNLCEGTGTNVFLARDRRLLTPPLSAGCLAGVTRELLMELVAVHEEDVPLAALADADEAFVTSSTREVQPVSSVDGRPLPAAPGPLTVGAADAFAALVAADLDP